MERLYEVTNYETPTEFLETLARKAGRLLKGGEPDVNAVAKMVLNDFLRGKLPWFTPPPAPPPSSSEPLNDGVGEGDEGEAGEDGKSENGIEEEEVGQGQRPKKRRKSDKTT